MEIEFLGTGAGVPAKQRNVTSIALKLLDERNSIWLFDCGEGTQMQILKTSIRPRKIEKIFITHLHGDHIFGLPGLLSSRSFQGGSEPLTIYGPVGIQHFVKSALKVSGSRLAYPIHFVEVKAAGVVFQDQQFTVYAAELDHGIQSFGYRVVEAPHVGELQVTKLKALGVPAGPLYGKLKKGETVTLADGTLLQGKDFIGGARPGRIVAIFGDTRPTTASLDLARNADVMVHESTFGTGEEQMAKNYFHSTNTQAAQIARQAHVKKLLLTHISARYLAQDVQLLERDAQKIFPATKVVKDFDRILIPLKESEDER